MNTGDDPFEVKHGRISGLEQEGKPARNFPLKQIIILTSIAAVLVGGIIIATRFVYIRPEIFTPNKNALQPIDGVVKEMGADSDNIHIKRGRESYAKGYYNDAVSEFNEVVESGSSDRDKGIALAFLGMIADDRNEYDKAVEYYTRAMKYDSKNADIYKNLSIAYRHKKDYDRAADTAKESISLNAKDVNSKILLGNIYFDQGKFKEAADQYGDALKENPDNAAVMYNLGMSMLKTGDEFAAMEYLRKAAAADRIGEIAHRAYSRLGVMYTERKNFEMAEKYLKEAVSVRPSDALNRYNLGIAYMRQNKKEEAAEEFKKAEELGERDSEMLENLGDAYLAMRDYNRSQSVYERLLNINSRNVRILSRLGEIYYEKGELDRAYDTYKKITSIEPATENARIAFLNMGNILDDAQRFDEAVEAYNRALAISPKDDTALYNLGIAYKHAGKPELAVDAWRKAADLNVNDPKPLLSMADLYYERGFADLAEKEYEKVARRWPNIQEGHFKLATIYYKRNQLEYAQRAYQRVIEINENNELSRKAYINLGLIQAKTGATEESMEKSMQQIQKALLIKPGDPEALNSLGIIYSKKQMYDRAIDAFFQVVKASTDSKMVSEAYNNIGKAYYKKKQYGKALKAFTRGIEEDPSSEEIRMNRKTAMQAYEAEISRER